MVRLNATASVEELAGGRRVATVSIAPRHYRRSGGTLADIASDWTDSGDGVRPHLVTAAPFLCSVAPDGMRRIHPTREMDKFLEIGRPFVKVGGAWTAPAFSTATRTRNLIRWDNAQAALLVVHGGHFLKVGILLKNGYRPEDGLIAFPVGATGLSVNLRTGQISDGGVVVGKLRAPTVYDFDNPEDERPIEVTFPNIQGQRYALLQLPDLTGMSRPLVDPTYSSQPDATAGIDTSTDEQNPNSTTRGTSAELLHEATAGTRGIAFVKFDLSSIPGTATIDSATLSLWTARSRTGGSNRVMNVHRALSQISGWSESSNWNFIDFNASTRWPSDAASDGGSDAGGSVAGTDYSTTVMGSFTITVSQAAGTQHDITLDTTEMASMVAANHGFVIIATVDGLDVATRSSDEATETTQRPKLVVNYTEAGGARRPIFRSLLGVGY